MKSEAIAIKVLAPLAEGKALQTVKWWLFFFQCYQILKIEYQLISVIEFLHPIFRIKTNLLEGHYSA